jgi:hypothetical protein
MRDWRDGRGFEVRSSRFSELRTPNVELRIVPVARLGGMRKSAPQGEEDVLEDSRRAGEKSEFFSILLGK